MFYIFVAGILSVFSPCILPVAPIVMTSSLRHSYRTFFLLLLGFITSFTFVGALVSVVSNYVFFNPNYVRYVGAVLIILASLFILVPRIGNLLSHFSLEILNNGKTEALTKKSAFYEGVFLSLIWAPCVGPALGLALGWVAVTDTLAKGAIYLMCFGVGAATSLLLIAVVVRLFGFKFLKDKQKHLKTLYNFSAYVALIVGISILTSFDKFIETFLNENLPDWWLNILIRF